jgi:hypothetical protein
MIHKISPTQQVQCHRGIAQDDICLFCKEGIESLHHVITCNSRDMEGQYLFFQDIRGALRIKIGSTTRYCQPNAIKNFIFNGFPM